jgi:hypothetical protein
VVCPRCCADPNHPLESPAVVGSAVAVPVMLLIVHLYKCVRVLGDKPNEDLNLVTLL